MDRQREKTPADALRIMIKNLEQIVSGRPDFEELFRHLLIEVEKGSKENEKATNQLISKLLQICYQNSTRLQNIQPLISIFQESVFYKNKMNPQQETFILPIRNEESGKIEHGIVQQIEMIDDRMKGNYQQLNNIMCTRICYMNKTIDACLDYLKQNI